MIQKFMVYFFFTFAFIKRMKFCDKSNTSSDVQSSLFKYLLKGGYVIDSVCLFVS